MPDYGEETARQTYSLFQQFFVVEMLCYFFVAVFLLLTTTLLRKRSRGALYAVYLQAVCFPLLVVLLAWLEGRINKIVISEFKIEMANQALLVRTVLKVVILFAVLLLNALYFRKRKNYFESNV